jgi:hypothetical protein
LHIGEKHHAQAAGSKIKGVVVEREGLSICLLGSDSIESALFRALCSNCEKIGIQIGSRDVARSAHARGDGDCRFPGSAGNIEYVHFRTGPGVVDECLRDISPHPR